LCGLGDVKKIKSRYVQNNVPPPVSLKVPFSLTIIQKDSLLETENVVAYFEGSDKRNEHIILTAHYDHLGKRQEGIYRGADDDGSGTAALMEIARILKIAYDKGLKPRRSILIMPVSAEEKGLLGSAFYVNSPLLDLKQAIANLNIDMIGRKDALHTQSSDYVYIIGSDFISRELHDVNEEANKECVGLNLDYTFNDPDEPNRLYYRSDHYNFARHNIPCIFYFSGLHEDYHQTTDTMEKVDLTLLKKRVILVFETLWKLANREHRPHLDEK
jgi:Zn-dependent M28 family amino/carboxypeptidase